MIGTIQDEVVLSEDFDCRLRREVVGVAVVGWVWVEAVVGMLSMLSDSLDGRMDVV